MKLYLLFSVLLSALRVIAQSPNSVTTVHTTSTITSTASVPHTTFISQSPAMASSSVSSVFAALATATPLQTSGDQAPGDDSGGNTSTSQNTAGASGSDSESLNLSKGGLIAIVVVVVLVSLFGIVSSVLFYLAKKRSWEVKATIRRSAKRVVTALTPRRSEFPKSVKDPKRADSRGMKRMEDVPPTPRLRKEDLESGMTVKMAEFEMSEPPEKSHKWGRRNDR